MRWFKLLLFFALAELSHAAEAPKELVCGTEILHRNHFGPPSETELETLTRRELNKFEPVQIDTYFTIMADSHKHEDGYISRPDSASGWQTSDGTDHHRGTTTPREG
ncbi:hypothetical protein XA68_10423 [Ophiocordyceps unilateralis]|uniref:Uncharacterized protein n=1 Tax=Ophiocordyceps unilateralis TaxID=268505 RepID=A0A2A9PPP6_OPHUN|nr:hypothetical protein XA68_10423 [Ophiocordyceps unilateralis]